MEVARRMATVVIYDEVFLKHHTGFGHPESPRRVESSFRELSSSRVMLSGACRVVKPRLASPSEVELVHDPSYVAMVRRLCEGGGGYIDADTPVSKDSYEVALYAVGGVLKGCDMILSGEAKKVFGLVRPPGHHAGIAGRALSAPTAGFCIFNNVAIAARYLLSKGLNRVLILDHDCHHGNGTQEILYSNGKVLKVDLHQDPRTLYPGTGYAWEIGEGEGKGFMVNVPLPPGSGDDVYSMVIDELLQPLMERFKPEIVLVSAGFDAHKDEPITNMSLSAQGFSRIYDFVVEAAEKYSNGRVLATLEGGYGESFPKLVTLAVSKLAGVDYEFKEVATSSKEVVMDKARSTLATLKKLLSASSSGSF
ncbi:MAG: histone deacetylase [Candidatus Nezhaarchaeales archaeon]